MYYTRRVNSVIHIRWRDYEKFSLPSQLSFGAGKSASFINSGAWHGVIRCKARSCTVISL